MVIPSKIPQQFHVTTEYTPIYDHFWPQVDANMSEHSSSVGDSGDFSDHDMLSYMIWWLGHPSETYEFVNWDDDIPNISGKTKNV